MLFQRPLTTFSNMQRRSAKGGKVGNTGLSKNQLKKIERGNLLLAHQISTFDEYYSSHYGKDRWAVLKEALLNRGKYVALLNQRAQREWALKLLDAGSNGSTVEYLPKYFRQVFIRRVHLEENSERPGSSIAKHVTTSRSMVNAEAMSPSNGSVDKDDEVDLIRNDDLLWKAPTLAESLDGNGLSVYYPLDAASLVPVLLLDLQPSHHVLDLCAAPGGKSLAIAQQLRLSVNDVVGHNAEPVHALGYLQCNDVSPDRRKRLVAVLRRYLPPGCIASTHVSQGDATSRTFGLRYGKKQFDRILVDAPCSSERHLLHELLTVQELTSAQNTHLIHEHAKEFMSWKPSKCKTNADRQLSLLWNAMSLCQGGGKVVYSTCALSRLENDGVIEKLLQKVAKHNEQYGAIDNHGDGYHQDDAKNSESDTSTWLFQVKVVPIEKQDMPFGEPTVWGWQILPDNNPLGWGPIYASVIEKVPVAR